MKKDEKNAYMTVEASLLVPFIFGGILFTISLALYLYNATVLKQVSAISALRGAGKQETQREIEQYLESQVDKLIADRMILVSKVWKDVRVEEAKAKVTIKVKVNLPFFQIPFLDFEWQEVEFQTQAKRIKPVKIIRDTRRLYGS